jgi:hypothetical protein
MTVNISIIICKRQVKHFFKTSRKHQVKLDEKTAEKKNNKNLINNNFYITHTDPQSTNSLVVLHRHLEQLTHLSAHYGAHGSQ